MIHERIKTNNSFADGYIMPFGKFNMVYVKAQNGMIGCGMFDVYALDKFQYPAASVRPSRGDSIANIQDILAGIIKDANIAAKVLGVEVGMTGQEALLLLA